MIISSSFDFYIARVLNDLTSHDLVLRCKEQNLLSELKDARHVTEFFDENSRTCIRSWKMHNNEFPVIHNSLSLTDVLTDL